MPPPPRFEAAQAGQRMHFVQRRYSGLALAPDTRRVYPPVKRYLDGMNAMTLITALKTRIARLLRSEPVPCWTEYLQQTAPKS